MFTIKADNVVVISMAKIIKKILSGAYFHPLK